MPLSLAQLAANTASFTLQIQTGDTINDLNVEYYPTKVTEEIFAHMQKFEAMNSEHILEGFQSLNEVLCTLIKAWDLFEDSEQTKPYPLTPDALRKLPIVFRMTVLQGIMSHIRPEQVALKMNS